MKDKVEALCKNISSSMFATRDTMKEAYAYSMSVVDALQKQEQVYVMTAIQVLMNTIAKQLRGMMPAPVVDNEPKHDEKEQMLDAVLDLAVSVKFRMDNIDSGITPGIDIPNSVIIDAFQKRIDYLRENTAEISEAVGIVDCNEVTE